MRRCISCLLIIMSLVGCVHIISFASSLDDETIRKQFNKEIEEIYGFSNFYPEKVNDKPFKLYHIDQNEAMNIDIPTYVPAYGSPSGDYYREKHEYLGTTESGNDLVPNPEYGWKLGWSGRRIANWVQVREPWNSKVSRSQFDDKSFNIPGEGKSNLENAIQTGVDKIYAERVYRDINFGGKSKEHNNEIVHHKGEKPAGGWVKYVHVVIPPTYKAWGQGYIYLYSGNYMGIPIAPFDLISSDMSVELNPKTFSLVPNGERVKITATVKSNFEEAQDTDYSWEVIGVKTGKKYHLENNEDKAEKEKMTFVGYGESGKATGKTTVPYYMNTHSLSEPAVYDLIFTMPEEAVKVKFTINKEGELPKEDNISNNVAEITVPWQPFIRYDTKIFLDYNELSKQIEYAVSGGKSLTAFVSTPYSWSGNATGNLNIGIKNNPTALNGAHVKAGSNDPVDEASSSIFRYPIIEGTITRSDFGDNPDIDYLPNSYNPVDRNMIINFSGGISRPWIHYWSHEDSEGDTCYHETPGTSTGSFEQGQDVVNIVAKVYNGRAIMPDVVARHFKKQVDNNALDDLIKTMWWESEPYEMSVQRWMKHVFVGQPDEWVAIDGQYNRTFTQQNKAEIEWQVQKSMADTYKNDRKNAKYRKKGKTHYKKAVFATDKELQRFKYPIKSGYYFNPTGSYTFTVKTQIYKDQKGYTYEHEDLVDRMIEAFRYDSNMTYTTEGWDTYEIRLTAEDDELIEVEKGVTNKKEQEIPYSSVSGGYTHKFFKEILEGYAESNTEESKNKYIYREYIKEGHIYSVEEETTVTIKVNPENKNIYTYPNMKDQEYEVKAWIDDVAFETDYGAKATIKGIKSSTLLDTIKVTVKGSMYDDLNN